MSSFKGVVIGVIVFLFGSLIGLTFKNPYPCSESGIGCGSVLEMIADNWSMYVCGFCAIIGVYIVLLSIFDFGCDKEMGT